MWSFKLGRCLVCIVKSSIEIFVSGYQKDEFKPKEPMRKEIRFKNNKSGKLAGFSQKKIEGIESEKSANKKVFLKKLDKITQDDPIFDTYLSIF